MSILIGDGAGGGYSAAVTSENKLRAYCTTESESSYESEVNERAYTWTTAYSCAANDTILWLRNDSTTENLVIDKVLFMSDKTTRFVVHSPADGGAATGTAITGTNLNRKSGRTASAKCWQDETTGTQANIIANGSIVAGGTAILPIEGAIVLGYKDVIAVDTVATGYTGVTFKGYYHTAK
ncbi:MAG: hypothetical protein GY841_16050 [FCB group bacterium]|nr:hypothetical protein [FCB group bacterium]